MNAVATGFEPASPLAHFAEDLALLARLHERELTPDLLAALRAADFPACLALQPKTVAGEAAFDLLRGALKGAECGGDSTSMDALHADFAAIYLNNTFSVSPLECVWLDPEGLMLQEPMFEVRRWYTHYALETSDWRRMPDDHLVQQLRFIAHLLTHPLAHGPKDAAAFMDHHVLRWIELFAARVAWRCQSGFYAGLALVTADALQTLRKALVTLADMPEIELEPIEEERQRRHAAAQAESARFLPGATPSW